MATDPTHFIAGEFSASLSLDSEHIHVTQAGDEYSVRLSGAILGTSIRYAAQQRKLASRVAAELRRNLDVPISLFYAVEDAITRLERILQIIISTQVDKSFQQIELTASTGKRVSLLVESTGELSISSNEVRSRIFAVSKPILAASHLLLTPGDIVVGGLAEPAQPSIGQILRVLKVLQPANAIQIAIHFQNDGFHGITPRWIQSQIDNARQRSLVKHLGEGQHALTADGLNAVPTYASSKSPDIIRALELGRRRWYDSKAAGWRSRGE